MSGITHRRVAVSLVLALGLLTTTTVFDGAARAAGYPTIDGAFSGTGTIAGGSSFALKVTGRGGVPDTGVGAVALNVSVANATASSYLTVYPTGEARPTAANLVFGAGQTIPNMVV